MAKLGVENIPDDLYEALRELAHRNQRSIAAEVRRLIEENIPTPAELKRRRQFLKKAQRLHERDRLTDPQQTTKNS